MRLRAPLDNRQEVLYFYVLFHQATPSKILFQLSNAFSGTKDF